MNNYVYLCSDNTRREWSLEHRVIRFGAPCVDAFMSQLSYVTTVSCDNGNYDASSLVIGFCKRRSTLGGFFQYRSCQHRYDARRRISLRLLLHYVSRAFDVTDVTDVGLWFHLIVMRWWREDKFNIHCTARMRVSRYRPIDWTRLSNEHMSNAQCKLPIVQSPFFIVQRNTFDGRCMNIRSFRCLCYIICCIIN